MPPPWFLVPAVAVHLVVVAMAWRDIARRTPAQLRGSKALWRVITALNAGKYVAEGVYVGAQQGLAPGSSKAVVEIEILPRVTVQGDVSQNGGSGIGLNYKYDY